MSAPLPDALRARFQKLVEEGLSGRAAALRLKLSPATGAPWGLAIRRTGRARAAPQGRPKGKGKLDPHRVFFAEIIGQDGDITMPELAAALLDATGVRAQKPHSLEALFQERKLAPLQSNAASSATRSYAPIFRASAYAGSGRSRPKLRFSGLQRLLCAPDRTPD